MISSSCITMGNNEAHNVNNSMESYYAFHRASVVINDNKNNRDSNDIIQNREIGRLFAEYKDKLVIIDGEDRKEHAYQIPKSKVDRYGDKKIYLNISYNSLKEFEV
jgi:hypothetical protein